MRSFHKQSSLIAAGLMLAVSPAAISQDSSAEASELPEAMSLYAKCFEQMGEQAVLEGIESASFTVVPPEMMGADSITVKVMGPDKCRIDASVMEGDAYIVVNGEHIWAQEPGGQLEYGADEEVSQIMLMMAPQYVLHMAPGKYQSKTTGVKTVGEEECYTVSLSEGEKDSGLALYFSRKSGLCAGFQMMNPMGMPADYLVKSWGEADGLKVITKASMDMTEMGMGEMVFEFKDFVFNKVEANVFDMPDEVKKLAEEAKAADRADGGDGEDVIRR